MEDKHILKNVIRAASIFSAALFCVECVLVNGPIWCRMLLAVAMWPTWLCCWALGIDSWRTINKVKYLVCATNALLYAIAYATIHWLILTRGRAHAPRTAAARIAISAVLFGISFLGVEEILGALNPSHDSLFGVLFNDIYGPAAYVIWRLHLRNVPPWNHLAMAATAIVYSATFALIHWSIIRRKDVGNEQAESYVSN